MTATDRAVVPLVTGATLRRSANVRLDGYGHAWIAPPSMAPAPVAPLNHEEPLVAALARFADAARPQRAAMLDCQPQGCGRDAAALARLSRKSGVAIAAVTGFFPEDRYPTGRRPWTTAEAALTTFQRELEGGMREEPLARPAAVAAALTDTEPDGDPCWDAAVEACRASGALLLVRTDGQGLDRLVRYLERRGLPLERVYLCRVDVRPDAGLHRELAAAGALLGYSTRLTGDDERTRPTYEALAKLLDAGCVGSLALGLELAEPAAWGIGADGGSAAAGDAAEPAGDAEPTHDDGPVALVTVVEPRLRALGASDDDLDALLGRNLLTRAARPEAPAIGR